jgi:hypothetical protein
MLGGLLDEEEKDFLSKKHYEDEKIFTPILDVNGVWVLPLHQIYDNINIDCWWVKHLPIIEYKQTQNFPQK